KCFPHLFDVWARPGHVPRYVPLAGYRPQGTRRGWSEVLDGLGAAPRQVRRRLQHGYEGGLHPAREEVEAIGRRTANGQPVHFAAATFSFTTVNSAHSFLILLGSVLNRSHNSSGMMARRSCGLSQLWPTLRSITFQILVDERGFEPPASSLRTRKNLS